MPDINVEVEVRHLVDVQQRLNCALPVVSLSRVHFRLRGLHRHIQQKFESRNPKLLLGLAVDLGEAHRDS